MTEPTIQLNTETGELELWQPIATETRVSSDWCHYVSTLSVLSLHNLAISIHTAMKEAVAWDEKEHGDIT